MEHELAVWQGDLRCDFRTLLPATGLSCFDPGDPRARRLPSGVALTADGWEAELATPPLPVERGADVVDVLLRQERTALRDFCVTQGADRISGFSTHLNVSVPDDRAVELARGLLPALPALARLTEPDSSSGVFLRPRRHRLEVGAEYVEGEDLGAALVLLACAVAALDAGPAPGPAPATTPSREKFGWFVAPDALTADPAVLERTWSWCRDQASRLGLDGTVVDLAVERGGRDRRRAAGEVTFLPDGAGATVGSLDAAPRESPAGLRARTVWLTWQHAVWLVERSAGERAWVVLPPEQEPGWLAELDAGMHDDALLRFMRGRRRRTLLVNRDVGDGGWWHEVRPGALVPAERGPDGRVPRVSRRRAKAHHRRTRDV